MSYKLNEYPPELPFKELECPQINEDILNKSMLTMSDDERIERELSMNPGRRDLVQTEDGIIRTAWHRGKDIKDSVFCDYIINTVSSQLQSTDDIIIRQQWIWGSPSITAHVDWGRSQFLMYILDTGGEDVITNFYLEPNQSLYRKWEAPLSMITDTRHLVKVHSVKFKPKTWYYFNPNIIHDVTGLTSCRIAICVQQGLWTPS